MLVTRRKSSASYSRIGFMRQLSDRSQNSLDTYLLDFYVKSGREAICRYQGVATLDEEMEYVIRQHSYG